MKLIFGIVFLTFAHLISAQTHSIGFHFIDEKPPVANCIFCNLNASDNDKLKKILSQTYSEEVNCTEGKVMLLEALNPNNSNELNGRLLLELFWFLSQSEPYCQENDSLIYNLSAIDYLEYPSNENNAKLGASYMIDIIDRSISYTTDNETILTLKAQRFKYLANSTILNITFISPELYLHDYADNNSQSENDLDLKIMKTYLDDKLALYNSIQNTNYKFEDEKDSNDLVEKYLYDIDLLIAPIEYTQNFFIGSGVEYLRGKNNWLSIEAGYGLRDKAASFDLYRLPFQSYLVNFGYNINLDTRQKDLYVSAFELKMKYFSLSLYRFGQHALENEKFFKSLFYRPEIGFHYGIFDLTYSYNVTFNKNIRPNTEKHLVSVGISYPLIRIGTYRN
jgi:hypothetical protein